MDPRQHQPSGQTYPQQRHQTHQTYPMSTPTAYYNSPQSNMHAMPSQSQYMSQQDYVRQNASVQPVLRAAPSPVYHQGNVVPNNGYSNMTSVDPRYGHGLNVPSPNIPSTGGYYNSQAYPVAAPSTTHYVPPIHTKDLGSGPSTPLSSFYPQSPSPSIPQQPSPSSSSPQERFACSYCDKTFSRSFDRRRHMTTHVPGSSGANRCAHCSREYSRPDSLKRHLDNGCDRQQQQ